jgi:hypothetical protein
MTGTTPAVGMEALGALYPPHPNHSSVNNNTEIIFMTFSSPLLDDRVKSPPECQPGVIFL